MRELKELHTNSFKDAISLSVASTCNVQKPLFAFSSLIGTVLIEINTPDPVYDKTKLLEKSDIFTKRTIVPPKAVEHVDTALEALTLSE